MIRDFSRDELDPAASSNETELTIGGGLLLALGGGLFLLCAVCFGAGYFVGHRSSSEQATALTTSDSEPKAPTPAAGSGSKPGAARQPAHGSADSSRDEGNAQLADADSPVQGVASSSQALVKPALSHGTDGEPVQPAMTAV